MTDDVMRKKYIAPLPRQMDNMNRLKSLGEEFVKACDQIGEGRELSLAKTNMEQAVMWASKGIMSR